MREQHQLVYGRNSEKHKGEAGDKKILLNRDLPASSQEKNFNGYNILFQPKELLTYLCTIVDPFLAWASAGI